MLSRKIPLKFIWGKLLNLSHEGLWVFVGQAGMVIVGLLGIKLLTHFLDPFEFGLLVLANTIMELIRSIFFVSFGQGLIRFWAISKHRGNLDVFYAVSNRLSKYASLVALLAIMITLFILSITKYFDWAILVTLSLIIGIILGIFSFKISIFTAARQRRRIAILNIIHFFLRLLIAIFLVTLIIAKTIIVLAGYLLAAFCILLIAERFYSKNVFKDSPNSLISNKRVPLFSGLGKEILSYSWPFLVWGIFVWIHFSSARWCLQLFYGSEIVGTFAVISFLANYPLNFGSMYLYTLFSPISFQKAGDLSSSQSVLSAYKILCAMTAIYIVGAIILITLFSMFYRPLVFIISNVNFVQFSYMLPGLTIAWALFYSGQMLTSFGLLANKSHSYILPKVTAAIIACVGIFYLSPKIGPVGIVWGLILANSIYALWCFLIAIKYFKYARFGSIAELEQ